MLRTTALCLNLGLSLTLMLPLAARAQDESFRFTVRPAEAQGKVSLVLNRDASRNNRDSRDFNQNELEGLSFAGEGPLRFRIVRAAGALSCEGRKADGRGEGICRFARDAGYFATLDRHNVRVRDDWESWQLAAFDVKLALLDELRRQDYRTPSFGDLIASAIFQLDVNFLRALDAAGYRQRELDDLIPFRIHKITPEYIGAMKAANPRLSLETKDLVALSVHKVTPEWVSGWVKLGYNLDAKQLVNTRIHNVSPDYARSMMAEVRDKPSVDQFVAMRIHGARPGR